MKKRLTVNTLAFGNFKARKKQYTSVIIGIVLAMMFSSGVPFFVSCMNSSREEYRHIRQGKQDYIVLNAQNYDFKPMVQQGDFDGNIGYGHIISFAWNEKEDQSHGTMIGWLDDRAAQLYYPNLLEGKMPEKENEIAVEKSALQRMRLETKVGEKIALKTLTCNGEDFLSQEKDKTYTLVGILSDKKSNLEHLHSDSFEKTALIPAAFVAQNSQTELGGKEALIAFLNVNSVGGSLFYDNVTYEDRVQTDEIFSTGFTDGYSNISRKISSLIFLSILLAFLSCFAIVNAFNSNLKERKNQIGMLKAVGATRRQIINIFGREAFIICAFSVPLSVAVSYGAVKIFAKIMGESFIFKPNLAVLAVGALFGVVCVMLSALIPLLSISKLPPMQAIRDIELMRKMKNKKIKSQKQFNVFRLLAKRKLAFSKGRQISVCVIIACSVIICCTAISFLYATLEEAGNLYSADYEIIDYGEYNSSNKFINYPNGNSSFTENSINEILELPSVKDVYGEKQLNINIVFSSEVPEYLQINEYRSFGSSRFLDANDIAYKNAVENIVSGGTFTEPEHIEITEDNIKEVMQAEPNPDYIYTKQAAGFTNEELINTTLSAKSEKLFTFDESDIIDGEVNFDKINSGKEVVIYAPEKIGFAYEELSGGSYAFGIYNTSEEAIRNNTTDKQMLKKIKAEAQSPFKVGDTLTLSLICRDTNGKITREDREVKVGCIVGKKTMSGSFEIYTTVQGLDTFKSKFDYRSLNVELKEQCTAEIDVQMQDELAALFPGKNIGSAFAYNEAQKQELRTMVLSIGSLVLVMLCVCISLINNSVSAQIREGKRSIGTLRAVGASKRELTMSYILQIANMLLWGFGTGMAVYIAAYSIIVKIVLPEKFLPVVLWPAFLVCGIIAISACINIKSKIKTVIRRSIVENIREL